MTTKGADLFPLTFILSRKGRGTGWIRLYALDAGRAEHAVVEAAFVQECLMRARFDDIAVLEGDDAVGVAYRGKPVSNDDTGTSFR